MTHLTQYLIDLPLVPAILLKVTLVLCVGWMLHFALAKCNPRWQVLLWRGVIVGVFMVAVLAPYEYMSIPVVRPPEPALPVEVLPVAGPVADIEMAVPTVTRPVPEPQSMEVSRPSFSLSAWVIEHGRALAFGIWLLMTLVLGLRLVIGYGRVTHRLRSSCPGSPSMQQTLDRVARDFQCQRKIVLRCSSDLATPFLAGLFRPTIILPEEMQNHEYQTKLPAILTHELVHFLSGDMIWMLVTRLFSTVLWFHPLVWKLCNAHGKACETVCDGVAADYVGDAEAYATVLAHVALRVSGRPSAVAGIPMAREANIMTRLRRLKQQIDSAPLARQSVVISVLVGLMGFVGLGGLGLVYADANLDSQGSIHDIKGRVVNQQGRPIANAQVALSTKTLSVSISSGKLHAPKWGQTESRIVSTDAQGDFDLGQSPDGGYDVIVACEQGYACVRSEDLSSPYAIAIQPWARVEGKLAENRAAVESKVWMSQRPNITWLKRKRRFSFETPYDDDGRFVFEKVPPGWYEVGYLIRTGQMYTHTCRTPIEVKAGQTKTMALAGTGRPVIGRFAVPERYGKPIDFGAGLRSLKTSGPQESRPSDFERMTKREQAQWLQQYRSSDQYKQAMYDQVIYNTNARQYAFRINKDGAFRIEDVIPGKYTFTVNIETPMGQRPSREIASYYGSVTAPPMPGNRSDDPLDLGDLVLTMHHDSQLSVGDSAPLFTAQTLEGQSISLSEYRGRYVLLSFWTTTFHPELDLLKELHNTYGKHAEFAILGFGANDTHEEVKRYVKEADIPWPQVFVGEMYQRDKMDSPIARDYAPQHLPQIMLVGPEGKILAEGLRADKLRSVVQETLDSVILVPLPITLPKQTKASTGPSSIAGIRNMDSHRGKPRLEFLVSRDVTNVALNKPVTASTDPPAVGTLSQIVDGDKEAIRGTEVDLGRKTQWVQIDLESLHELSAILFWHFHRQERVYFDVVVQVADDPGFTHNVRTLFNNDDDNSSGLGVGRDLHYRETYEGKLVNAGLEVAQYVRLSSNENTLNDRSHYLEVEVYGRPVK
ncbi:MAG: redoxin domain-containing protein [Phycisphaeraceae bacterium]|nr:redoxin domain-containing protein [Phycisphaeraceae bacterium]